MLTITVFSLAYVFFVAASISLNRAKSTKLKELYRQNYFCARQARKALIKAERLFHSIQLGLFLSAVSAGLAFAIRFDPLLDSRPIEFFSVEVPQNVKFISFCLILGAFLVANFLAINAARVFALSRPNRTLCYMSVPLLLFSKIVEPISDAVSFCATRLARWFGVTPIPEREQFASADEINELVEKSTKAGKIEVDEGEMIKQVFTFSDTLVREVMTPRKNVMYVMHDIQLDPLIKLIRQEQFSRVLVCRNSLDDVIGVLHSKDLIPLVGRKLENFQLSRFIRPAFFVPNTKNVDQLLEEFKTSGRHFAVVLDEHGAVDGVVTIEDLIEELVGEIFDEYDDIKELPVSITISEGDRLVDASTNIEDFNDSEEFQLPEGPYDTVAGFIMHTLGTIPEVGSSFEYSGHIISIEEMDDTRIKLIKIARKTSQLAAA